MPLKAHPKVEAIRVLGAIGVIELKKTIEVAKIQKYFVANGVWIRPFRNLIYVMPPYIIEQADLIKLCKVMKDSIDVVL